MATTSRHRSLAVRTARTVVARHQLAAAAAVAMAAVLLGGCQGAGGPLSARDSFFTSPSSAAAHISLEAGTTIVAHRDLAEMQRACGASSAVADLQAKPNIDCRERTSRFFGRRAAAYRRWVEDQVRELPEPEETAASAGG